MKSIKYMFDTLKKNGYTGSLLDTSSIVKKVTIVIGGIVAISMLSPFAIVPAGSRGVITTFGKVNMDVLDEGLHFRIPIAQKVHLVDVQIQKGEGKGDAASKDLQTIHTTVVLNYHIDPKSAAMVFQEVGNKIGERIVVPAVQESVKSATAEYTAEELISKRSEVKNKITSLLENRLQKFGVKVDEFSVTNFDFSKSFNEAIESKTTAEQLKLKAERDLMRIKIEAEQKIASAKAEAESLRLQKQEVTPELLKLREIENQSKAIDKWNGQLPSVTGQIPFISLDAKSLVKTQ